jgi:hypothetical protein
MANSLNVGDERVVHLGDLIVGVRSDTPSATTTRFAEDAKVALRECR